jgi:hypothetical protein
MAAELTSQSNWICDSGASRHLTGTKDHLVDYETCTPFSITGISDTKMMAIGKGRVRLKTLVNGIEKVRYIEECFYVPGLNANLLSLMVIDERGGSWVGVNDKVTIKGSDGRILGQGKRVGRAYVLQTVKEELGMKAINTPLSRYPKLTIEQWHLRLGHANETYIRMMDEKKMVLGMNLGEGALPYCSACHEGKMSRRKFPRSETVYTEPLAMVSTDLTGPHVETPSGKRYGMIFVDHCSGLVKGYLLSKKSEATEKINEYIMWAEQETGMKMKVLRSDNESILNTKDLADYLTKKGIRHELTVPRTSAQNGVAERTIRTIFDRERSMRMFADMP